MFWQSLIEGFTYLKHYEIWVALFAVAALNFIVMLVIGLATSGFNEGVQTASGCLTIILMSLVSSISVGFLVLYFIPILHGQSSFPSLSVVFENPWPVIRVSLIATAISFVLAIIPIVGSLFNLPGFDKFVQAAIVYHLILKTVLPDLNINMPGFWVTIGFAVVCGVVAYIFSVILVLIQLPLSEDAQEGITAAIAPSIGFISGFVVFFMYIQYLLSINT